MLTLWGAKQRYCDGIDRRQFLHVGALGLGGLTLDKVLRSEARATEAARKKSVIYVVLPGGPSHIDMWDPKPDAPDGIRGEFGTIPTRFAGVRFSEHMPHHARMLDQITVLRGIQSVENDHFLGELYSGLDRKVGQRPAFGSVVSRLAPGTAALPSYVALQRETVDMFEFEKPYYAGAAHRPFRPYGEAVGNLGMKKEVSLDRLQDRKQLLRDFDTLRRDLDTSGDLAGMDKFATQAFDMIASDKARAAFDLSKEDPRTFDRYGKGKWSYNKYDGYDWDSRPLVLARRLVEAGVRTVTLSLGTWDHHGGEAGGSIFRSLKTLVPLVDRGIYALVDDLKQRGLENDVLVVVLGEFGRSPRIDPSGPGRDHHAPAGCAVFFGGGLKMARSSARPTARANAPRVAVLASRTSSRRSTMCSVSTRPRN